MAKLPSSNKQALVRYRGRVTGLRQQIAKATTCEQAIELLGAVDSIEDAMCNAGYRHDTEAIRPANEARFEARWQLGRLLSKVEKDKGGRPNKNSSRTGKGFSAYLTDLGLNKNRANECERIGAIPKEKLPKAFEEAARDGVLNTVASMFLFARPFWKIAVRRARHRRIHDAVVEAQRPDEFGPFALLYADPPTEFETYTEGSYRGPNQHYPTLPWDQIENFTIYDKRIEKIMHENAMLFLWSTSSNLVYAINVMRAWGFEFKASATWDKGKIGTGLIFRNQHEVLLYGSRGDVPGPIHVPPSVFRYPRGEHSAKPKEIRDIIERMYPDYDASTRLELFSRDSVPGWTHFGFEANRQAAE